MRLFSVFFIFCFLSVNLLNATPDGEGRLQVVKPVYFDVSPPLRDILPQSVRADISWKDGIVWNYFREGTHPNSGSELPAFFDQVVQNFQGPLSSDTTLQNFDGLAAGPYIPPDTDGDIGPDHYFQVVNASFAVYNKSGGKILGPLPNSSVWNGLPNNENSGDAVVLYDENANRWFFAQFSLPSMPAGPFFMMVAVSQTPDPTGSWYRYQYEFADMPDYPKFAIWPDGYYMSVNRFAAISTGYVGTGAAAFDRSKMLAGDPTAAMIYFMLPSSNEAFSLLPSDCDGEFPPMGTPNYFTYAHNGSNDHLGILEFHADWATPANSTFGNLTTLPVTSYNPDLGPGIPQLGTSARLSTLSDRLMFRLQFRKFSDHWSMVVNHSVNVGSNVAGLRWYELRKTTGAWGIFQESTYSPDNTSRWMGSIAMDSAGNIAIGYSASSASMYPAIRYAGRLKNDPLNQMTIAERTIINGGGCQTSSSKRWGDYSSMRIDPASPTTFWYTTEYYSMTSSSNWQTRIASFSFMNVFSTAASATPNQVCAGDSIQLNAVAYGGSGNYTYAWSSDPAGFSSSLPNPKTTPTDTTRYFVVISDGSQTHYDTTFAISHEPPVSSAGNDTLVCAYQPSVALIGSASNYNAVSWATSGNGHFTSQSSLNTTYLFGPADYQNGGVDLLLFAFPISPCSGNAIDSRHVTLDPCTGVAEESLRSPTLTVHPNPAQEKTTITLSGVKEPSVLLEISDLNGKSVSTMKLPIHNGTASTTVDLHSWQKGTFIVRMITGKVTLVEKLVVL